MEINSKTLKETIKTMAKDQNLNDVLEIILNEMSDVQLQNVIYCIMDPEYHTKTNALANPVRFTTNGVLNQEKIEDVKLEKTTSTVTDEIIEKGIH